ncbi:MAG: hypothetical protein M3478_05135 [Planctomycetota bacterium]|nr:hypothetical protein [Planctomycetota bacterium]
MKRKLYNYATLASLVLLCGCLWWWNHSSRSTDQVTLHGLGGASVQLTGSGGQVMFTKAASSSKDGGELSWKSSSHGGEARLLATSFTFDHHGANGVTFVAPSWALALVFAILPSLWVYSKVHGKRGGKKKDGAH